MRVGLSIILLAAPLLAHEMTAEIRLFIFSGRVPPRTIIADSAEIVALRSAVDACMARPIACSEVPPPTSILGYRGLAITLSPPFPGADPGLTVSEGYAHSGTGSPCYADSGRELERIALEIAFRHDDVDYPGGPAPMGYLACGIPDEVRPAAAICSTTSLARKPRPSAVGLLPDRPVDAAGRAREATAKGRGASDARPVRVYARPRR